jgi:hypothetical protein
MIAANMEILDLKKEIAEEYIKKFKDELGRFKSLALLPIEKKIKDIIVSNKDVGTNFTEVESLGVWKNIINFLSTSTAEQIYDFIKNKKEELAIKNTKEELEALRQEIITGVKPTQNTSTSSDQNMAGTTVTSAVAAESV